MTVPSLELDAGATTANGAQRPTATRYGVAIGAALVAVLLTWQLTPIIPRLTWLPVLGAVSVSAWFGGLGPGLAAAAAGALGVLTLVLPPVGVPRVERQSDLLWMAAYAVVALLVSVVTSALHRDRAVAAADAERYRELAQRLQAHADALGRAISEHRAAERALRASEERFRLLVEGVADYAILGLDPDGRVASWNAGAQRLEGYTAEEIVGRHVGEFYPPEDRHAGRPQRHVELAVATGRFEEEGWRVRRDGTRFWSRSVITALRRDDGTLVGYSYITRDLTDQHRQRVALERSEARLASIIASAMDAIVTVDESQRIVLFNAAAERLFGVPAAEALGHSIERFIPVRFRDRHAEQVRQFGETGETSGEAHRANHPLPALRADGTEILVEATISRVEAGGERLFTVMLRDVSERLRTEAELRRANEELQQAVAIARAASRAKSDFLATMSHEIRTPINAILGFNELLEMGVAGPLTAEQRGYLERVRASGRHLLGIVNELLDLAKVEAGQLAVRRRPAQLVTPVDAAVTLMRAQVAAHGLELHLRCDASLGFTGDEDRVRQIVMNLLSNAVKFTPPGGRITVQCGTGATDAAPAAVFVRVEDTGIGIPPDMLERVFEPFVQLDAGQARGRGGTGLGLAISRQLARLMDGELVAASRPGEGATFTLWLPAADLETAPASGDDAAPARATPPASAPGVGTVGALLTAGTVSGIVDAIVDRLRADPGTAVARSVDDAVLEDHMGTILRDIARLLVFVASRGASDGASGLDDAVAELMADGSEIQRVIAERHGVQRARHGWTEEALAREFEIVRQEMERAVRRAAPPDARDAVSRSLELLRPLLDRAASISLASLRAELAASRAADR